ncbi:hypothetical protein ACFO0N_14005 [Halobium salinum]|uniref:Uncharacterized protein n=1 Tax=Halobium salinum TaxID=1364940 RepID=A0ABD5PEV5_9EURY|nr:hypothetical protein [Halobium salinum]
MTGYYDYVLGLIPVAMLGITAVLTLVGFSLSLAVPVGASASALVIGHALFVNGPVTPGTDAPTPATATQQAPVNAD